MSRFTKQITSYWQQFRTVVRNEYGSIFTDAGVILVLVLALLIYSTLYSLAYGTQVLRNVPIGVIDMSNTSTSRQLINTFNAGPNVYVAYEPGDMDEAKHLFYDREIYGVVYIPSDYEEKLLGGQQAVVSLYVDASYFLMYRQAFQELVSGIGTTGAMVEFQRLIAKGANIPQATATTQPVIYQSHNLFNPYLGYGSFVMPAIIMVIIQQTMLIGIGMIGGAPGANSDFTRNSFLRDAGECPRCPSWQAKRSFMRRSTPSPCFIFWDCTTNCFISRPTVTRRTSSPFSSRICCPVFSWASPSRRCSSDANSRSCCYSGVRSRL